MEKGIVAAFLGIAGIIALWVTIAGAVVYGWVMNIVTLYNGGLETGQAILRGFGIIFFPLGAILGYC